GDLGEAASDFEQVGTETGVEADHRAIAGIGLDSARWAQRSSSSAPGFWPGSGGTTEVALARAAAKGRARANPPAIDAKSLMKIADAGDRKTLSSRGRRYLIEIYLAAGAPQP